MDKTVVDKTVIQKKVDKTGSPKVLTFSITRSNQLKIKRIVRNKKNRNQRNESPETKTNPLVS